MWSAHAFGITFVVLLSCSEIRARVIPETTSDKSTEESIADRYKFLDQVSASKIECLLTFIEQPGANPECIDKLFGDERSQFLLDELSRELAGDLYPDEEITKDEEDKDDQLVADLNTLSEKAGILSTINDDIPIINSNKDKRVEEQVDTPKKEEQRKDDAQQNIDQVNVAEVVKSVDDNEDDEKNQNGIDEDENDYEYDSTLVSKLYNMLQDLVMKETFDYGLKMDADDNDSTEVEEEDDNENVVNEQNKNIGEVEEDEQGEGQVDNEMNTVKVDENDDDEIEKELKQMQGTQTEEGNDEDEGDDDDDDAENVAELENDLVQELDRMLAMAKQVVVSEGKTPYKTDVDIISNDKFLRNMEKQLKKSSGQ